MGTAPAEDSASSHCHCDITILGAASHAAGREHERVKAMQQEEARQDENQDETPLGHDQKDANTGLSMAELRKVRSRGHLARIDEI